MTAGWIEVKVSGSRRPGVVQEMTLPVVLTGSR